MLRRILSSLGWAAGLLVAICLGVYVIVAVINRHDAAPSAAAIRMEQMYASRPAVRDEDNGFNYVIGFEVAPGGDPGEMGLKRIEWLRHYDRNVTTSSSDPVGEHPDYKAGRHPILETYAEACRPDGTGCRKAFEAAVAKFPEWESSEQWLFERYRALISHPAWREFVPSDIASPLPPYTLVMDGQKLLLLKARIAASERDAVAVNELLATDLRFWRTVLASSDTLITKMIATAAITRHFRLGATALRGLAPQLVSTAIPTEWRSGLTDQELSLSSCLVGEYIFIANMLRNVRPAEEVGAMVEEENFGMGLLARFSALFYQPQDTINRAAEPLARAVELLEGVELAEIEAVTDRIAELNDVAAPDPSWPRSPYNLFGQIILRWGPGDYGIYTARVGDLEGVRRAALAAVRLHEDQVQADEIAKALAESEFRNPYDGKPFEWDEAEGTVIFRGLQPGDRGTYRIG